MNLNPQPGATRMDANETADRVLGFDTTLRDGRQAPAPRHRVHVFLATSPIHREHKLRMTPAEVVRVATGSIEYARERCQDVEFSAEDAARTELDFLTEVVERAIEAGATTINIPDTVGYAMPAQFGG